MSAIIDVNTMFGPLPIASTDLPVDDLLELMRRHSVTAAFTMSTVGMLMDHNAGNAATRAACREAESLKPVATVNPLAYFGGEGPAMQFTEEGFKLVRFFPASQGWPIRFAPFRLLLQTLADRDIPVMVATPEPGMATDVADVAASCGCRVVLSEVSERGISEAIAILRAHPSFYVETSGLTAAGALKLVVAGVGAERVLYGSAAPARPIGSALAVVRHSGLSDADQEAILGGNARALFGL